MNRSKFLSLAAGAAAGSLLNSCTRHISAQAPFQYRTLNRSVPTADDLKSYYERFTNWGRWGKDDKLGTLNFIDEEVVLNAKNSIRLGRSFTLGRQMTSGKLRMIFYDREGTNLKTAHDEITVTCHGYTETHIDALSHIYTLDEKVYNGYSQTLINEKGASVHGIENWKDGIATRGVLYDISKLRGVPFIPIDEPVQGYELEDYARKHNIQPKKGDATIIHCGRNEFFRSNPNNPNWLGQKPGLNPSVLEFLHAYNSALLGCDFDEAPNLNNRYPTAIPIHAVANPYMGLPTL
ncbi:MAG: cyclase family protein [Chitinophagaceae bacterium]|nr:cyclase family protein [Chitinophagaceae bacterium]